MLRANAWNPYNLQADEERDIDLVGNIAGGDWLESVIGRVRHEAAAAICRSLPSPSESSKTLFVKAHETSRRSFSDLDASKTLKHRQR
jgi:hypothetical protein